MIKKKSKRIIAGALSLALCATTAGAAAAYRGVNKVDGAAGVTVTGGVKADAAWSGGEIRDGYEFLSEFTVPARTLTVGNKSAAADSVVIRFYSIRIDIFFYTLNMPRKRGSSLLKYSSVGIKQTFTPSRHFWSQRSQRPCRARFSRPRRRFLREP